MEESTNKAGKVTQALSPVKLQKVKGGGVEDESTSEERVWSIAREEVSPSISRCVPNHPHSKKVMKHALRQQAKRRRKNTTIAAGNSAPLPRPILVPPQAELEEELESRVRPSTMMEVLNSIPGFTLKPRKRSNKKLSPAAQLEQLQTKEGSIDLETPDSILVQTNLRFLLNKHTFASLPPLYQCKLVQLLPHVDRTYHSDSTFRLSASGLNNEFFARALQQWRERLAEGEFTPENQQRLKLEAEKEKSKLDPWKLKHFEPIWGESNYPALHTSTSTAIPTVTSPEWTAPKASLKATIKIRPPTARLRTVGAVTRAVSSYRGKREAEDHDSEEQPKRSKSDAQAQILAALSNHLSETGQDQTDYSSSSRIHETDSVASTSGIIPSHISTAEKCSMEVEAASELTCIIPSEEVFNAPPMETKSEGHDSDDFIYVDPSVDFNESESETTAADESGGDKDSLLCPVSEEICSNVAVSSENDSSVNVGSLVSSESISLSQSEIEENFTEAGEVMASQSVEDSFCSKDENATVKSQEASPLNVAVTEELESETVAQSEGFVDTGSEPVDSVPEISIPINARSSENEEFFSKDNNTNSSNAESESKDSQPLIQERISLSPVKSENGQEDTSEKLEPTRSSPLAPAENISDQNFAELESTTPNQIPAPDLPSESETFSQETNNPEISDCTQAAGYSENNDISEETSANLAEESFPLVDQELRPPQDSSHLVENSEVKDTPSNETSSSDKDSAPSALSESNLECLATVENSETAELPACSKNTPSSPLMGDTNFKESESALEPPASRLSPGVSVNFEERDFETSIPNDSNPETEPPLEECSKEMVAPTWDGVDSSTDKLSEPPMDETQEGEVAVIPMQEELEVRLEESPLPAPTCEWSDFDKSESSANPQNPPNSVPYPGHVKLELEVTLTPEVDSQVSSTVESSGAVIAPTTIVCLPSVAAPPLPPVPSAAVPTVPSLVSSPALPYLALSTSTPVTAVRAIPPKPSVMKPGGPSRGARSAPSKPPPGAVNLERSYQICQAVIQNSPNRDQLRSQLKPPPSSLLTKEGVKTGALPSKGNRPGTQTTKPVRGHSAQPVLVKHVFTSSQGIPVTMAVLPPANTPEMTDGGQFLLVQRGTGLSGVRRSSSAPPANNKLPVGSVAINRPASVGIQAITRDRFNGADSPVQNIYNKQQSMENCSCNLNAMVVCQKCGAFCHDDCISPSRLCLTCLIR